MGRKQQEWQQNNWSNNNNRRLLSLSLCCHWKIEKYFFIHFLCLSVFFSTHNINKYHLAVHNFCRSVFKCKKVVLIEILDWIIKHTKKLCMTFHLDSKTLCLCVFWFGGYECWFNGPGCSFGDLRKKVFSGN